MRYFFDTSALAKIYHREDGTEIVPAIYNNYDHRIMISELTKVEFYSTIYRKYREKEINHRTLNFLVEKFDFDVQDRFEILNFSSGVVEQAQELLANYGESRGIKALDSLQFAFYHFFCNEEDIFVCSDEKLIKIVEEEKGRVLNP